MNSIGNSSLRELLRLVFFLMAKVILITNWIERKSYRRTWNKRNLLQGNEVPGSFEMQHDRLELFAQSHQEEIFLAETSGTINTPKKIPYTKSRMELTQKTFLKSMVTLTAPFPGRKTFFVFSSLSDDSSLTSGMLQDREPSLIELLQAPYRFLTTKDGKKLRQEIGDLASRVLLIAVTSPRYFYATNPSTLCHFMDEIINEWPRIKIQLGNIPNSVMRLADGNVNERLEKLLKLDAPTLKDLAPDLIAIISWDGGYVAPFLNRLKEKLPGTKFIPMYSMSTESIETLPHRVDGKLHFLPTMKGVLPEFLKDGQIYSPFELKSGETYTLLVTDQWGMVRYDTQDEFEVLGFIDDLPDLRFKRRRNITASMTGEKITEVQCLLLFSELKTRFKLEETYLSLFGRIPGHYQINLIGPVGKICLKTFAKEADALLSVINKEYATKLDSGRLQPMQAQYFSVAEFAELMGQKVKWESQFKVMPLYEKPLH